MAMMTYSQSPSYNNYERYPSSSSSSPSARRFGHTESASASSHLGQAYYNSPSSTASNASFVGSNTNPRTLPPYISLQRVSEPASPATIATTISSHSTPSPSPSRSVNMPNTASNTDFTLFDDAIMAFAQDLNGSSGKGRTALDVSSSVAENSSALNGYSSSGFPIIVPHDASYSSYAQSGLYGNYPSGGYPGSDASSNFYNLSQDRQVPQTQRRQQQQLSSKYLRPASYPNPSNDRQRSTTSSPVEPVENVPALSPTSKSRSNPRSPHLQAEANMSQNTTYSAGPTSYLHPAMPKLGRTYSDAAQDELYNPESAMEVSQKRTPIYPRMEVKSEASHSFPRIFQEAQQQHQHDFSHSPQSAGIDQSQLAIALTLQDRLRKETERTAAPKTISPRESLLEYQEPESHHNQMALFPPLRDTRIPTTHEDVISNGGSLHASSQDGSDLDDFQSMATSRRESIANSSVSSHPDVPRFPGYMQQSQFDAISANPYYYADSNSLGSSLQMHQPSTSYVKEDLGNSIPRPLDTSANTGTYTCTYSGCGQRFTTSTKLQKHRREAHRKFAPSGNSVSSAAAIASRNAQPGPHRCMRVNPSTGKPCNTVFSRPYDLTRHEDTIHNTAKTKVRCEICDDDKFFSRSDALVRHRRVKHGIH